MFGNIEWKQEKTSAFLSLPKNKGFFRSLDNGLIKLSAMELSIVYSPSSKTANNYFPNVFKYLAACVLVPFSNRL